MSAAWFGPEECSVDKTPWEDQEQEIKSCDSWPPLPVYSKPITKVVVCLRLCPLCLRSLGSERCSQLAALPRSKAEQNSGRMWCLGLLPIVLLVGFVTLSPGPSSRFLRCFCSG